ncbi:hypothetical protein BB561_001577 [Smittium simulii]|uniref:Uncharacterized protein n=1 Tax=Smittium simulii TaxID=133385 RepID=A0A2T9YU18_9FUNG|nr:hypothetical protein BB561_001577 [Smittium simulii]
MNSSNPIWPTVFESHTKIDPSDWIDKYKLLSKLNRWTEEESIDLIQLFLGKKEELWFKSVKKDITNVETLEKMFKDKFASKEFEYALDNKHRIKVLENKCDTWASIVKLITESKDLDKLVEKAMQKGSTAVTSSTLRAWIADLTKNPIKAGTSTWASENIEHILLDCSRWAVIRKDTTCQFILRLYKLANLINNKSLKEAQKGLVGKLHRGESKLFFSQLKLRKGTNISSSMELETAKFMNVIHVAQALIVNNINCSSTSLNR